MYSMQIINKSIAQIDILGFPPNTAHILQPLDVGVFNHVKKEEKKACVYLKLDRCLLVLLVKFLAFGFLYEW